MELIVDAPNLDTYLARNPIIIDARSPAEFAEDHIPGALNVPMLDNQQRIEVGTLYKEQPFEARKIGAAYAVAAIERFLHQPIIRNAGKKTAFMIYCARGGMRSGSLSAVLDQIGFTVFRLARGYKSYRAWIMEKLEQTLPQPVHVLYGFTGSRKTQVLHALTQDVNVLDLEGLAKHKGSLLGDLPDVPQPTQRAFETDLIRVIKGFDPTKPTLMEGESRKIGKLALPPPVWKQLQGAQGIWLEVPRPCRTGFILEDYVEMTQNKERMDEKMRRLGRYLSKQLAADIAEARAADDYARVVDLLLEGHYDPLYGRRRKDPKLIRLEADSLQTSVDAVRRVLKDI